VKVSGKAGILGTEVEAAAWSAVFKLSSRGPVTMTRCQGWMLEFEGESWASWRAVVRRWRGIGVGRNRRLECLFLIASSRVEPVGVEDGGGASAAMFVGRVTSFECLIVHMIQSQIV